METDMLKLYESSRNPFILQIRNIWADNGDMISKIYAGTGATTSSVTRGAQKKGLFSYLDHGVKTISRFYVNNFEDDFKQKIYNLIVKQKQAKKVESRMRQRIKIINLVDKQ